jgi:ligand-binding sensor domain-containing protein/DNA-binding CsgD family transcriptional regulator
MNSLFKNIRWLGLFFIILSLNTLGQVKKIGHPSIHSFPRKITQAGQQNWGIDQDQLGIMYFANNDGLLEFNGFDWLVHPLPNNSAVRSVKAINEQIFVGGFNEFGFFERDYLGHLNYQSLIELLPEDKQNFGDIWKIYKINNHIIFQCYKYIFFYDGTKISRIIPAPGLFHFSFELNGELFVNDLNYGLFRVAPKRLVLIPGLEKLKGKEIWGMLPYQEGILLATADDGLFFFKNFKLVPWETPTSKYLQKNQVYSLLRLKDNNLAFGTIQNGLLISSNQGEILKILNLKNGIQNNTILSLKQDSELNLWLGLDNGIDYVKINSPFSYFDASDDLSAGYASTIFKDYLYLGTNQGVFYKSLDDLNSAEGDAKFSIIENTRGQVWSLNTYQDILICGHNKGFYEINKNKAKQICNNPGGWELKPIPAKKNMLIGGTYNGFVILEKKGQHWVYKMDVKGFEESARVFEWENDSVLWMSHGLNGVYKLTFNTTYSRISSVQLYGKKDGLPSNFSLEINRLDNKIIVASSEGLYSYHPSTDRFERNVAETEKFKGLFPLKIKEDKIGNIWFFTRDKLAVLRKQEDGRLVLIQTPFTAIENEFVSGFQHLNPISDTDIYIGLDNGFVHYNPNQPKIYTYDYQTYITRINYSASDSLLDLSNIVHLDARLHHFNSKENQISFSYAANDFENSDKLLYSTKLVGYDKDWQAWTKNRTKEYTNLSDGEYNFNVRAKNNYGKISKSANFQFIINPPWYNTWQAYLVYLVLLFLLILLIIKLYKNQTRILKRKEKIEQLRLRRQNENRIKREMLQTEKELIRLKNDQLRSEMLAKDKELANSTLQMIQKNKLLNRLKTELDKLNTKTDDEMIRHHNRSLIRRINREIEDKNQWKVFEEHFEAVHEAFLKRLKTAYPDLSPRELKLAAYLRLNISTKEIALLMNISPRGVEIARYRLRKKFKLDRSTNLLNFILNF